MAIRVMVDELIVAQLMANSSRPIDCCTAWAFQRRLGQFSFVQGNLNNFHARDDYKELLGLALICSGVPPADERTSLLLELSTEHGGGWQ